MKSLRQQQIDEVLGYYDNINRDTFEREKKFVFISGQQESPPTKDDLVVEASIREFTQAINYDLQNIAQAVNYIPSTFALQILRNVYEEEEIPHYYPRAFEPRGSKPAGTFEVGEDVVARPMEMGVFDPDLMESFYEGEEKEGEEDKYRDPREEAYLAEAEPEYFMDPEKKSDNPHLTFKHHLERGESANPEYEKQIREKGLEREKSSKDTFEKISLFLTKLIRDWNNLADFINIKLRQLTVKNITTFMMPIKSLIEPIKDVLSRIVILRTQTPEYYKIYNTLTMLYNTVNETDQIPIRKLDPREIETVPATEGDATRVSYDQAEMARMRGKEYEMIINDLSMVDYTSPEELENAKRLVDWYRNQQKKLATLIDSYNKIPKSKDYITRRENSKKRLTNLFRNQDEFRERFLKKYPETETSKYIRKHAAMENPSLATISGTRSEISSRESVGSEYSSLNSYRPGSEYRESRRSEPSHTRFPSGYSRIQEESYRSPVRIRRHSVTSSGESEVGESKAEKHVTSSEEESASEVEEGSEYHRKLIKELIQIQKKLRVKPVFAEEKRLLARSQKIRAKLDKLTKKGEGKPKKGGNDNFHDEASLAPYLTKHLKPSKFQGVPIVDEVNMVTGGRKKRVKHRKPLVDNNADQDMWFL